MLLLLRFLFFFFNDTATTEIYPLSLHDALPIYGRSARCTSTTGGSASAGSSERTCCSRAVTSARAAVLLWFSFRDRKSTRLNSSHLVISYAVFCLKKKKSIRIYVVFTW